MNAYDIQAELSRPVPAGLLSTKTLKGTKITYVSWYDLCDLADERAPGWCHEVMRVDNIGGKVAVTVRVTLPTDHGAIWREAIGSEHESEDGYGDAFSNAEAMAIRRAFAKFGLARELYGGKGAPARQRIHATRHDTPEPTPVAAQNGHVATDTTTNGSAPQFGHNGPQGKAEYPPAPEHWTPEITGAADKAAVTNIMRWIKAVELDAFRRTGALAKCYIRLAELALSDTDLGDIAKALNKAAIPNDRKDAIRAALVERAAVLAGGVAASGPDSPGFGETWEEISA